MTIMRQGVGSAENVSDLTGLKIEERFPVSDGPWSRLFPAQRNEMTLEDGSRSVFFALPPTPEELREAFRAAGAHVWTETPDTLAAGRGFVMLHAGSSGEKKIRLPTRGDVTELFGAEPPQKGVLEIKTTVKMGETRVYLVADGQVTGGKAP